MHTFQSNVNDVVQLAVHSPPDPEGRRQRHAVVKHRVLWFRDLGCSRLKLLQDGMRHHH